MNLDSTTQTRPAPTAWWRFPNAFYAAAVIDLLLGLDLILFAGWLAAQAAPAHPVVFGIETATLLRIAGVVLIVFAAETALAARSKGMFARMRPLIVATNWAFVAASVVGVLFLANALSGAAIALLLIVAAATAFLALGQQRSLRAAA